MSLFSGLKAEPASGQFARDKKHHSGSAQRAVRRLASQPAILVAHSMREVVFSIRDRIDFGPFVDDHDDNVEVDAATRRWLRVLLLVANLRIAGGFETKVLEWLDAPHPDLHEQTPFVSTKESATFARAYALLHLSRGEPLKEGSFEASLLDDFDEVMTGGADTTCVDRSELLPAVQAIVECCGSFLTAVVHITCHRVRGDAPETLYRLLKAREFRLLNASLKECGYAGPDVQPANSSSSDRGSPVRRREKMG